MHGIRFIKMIMASQGQVVKQNQLGKSKECTLLGSLIRSKGNFI